MRVLVASTAALAFAAGASAHGETAGRGFQSAVRDIQPPVPGLLVDVLEGDLLSVRNRSGKTVVLNAPGGEPLFRFETDAVYRADGRRWSLVKRGTSHAWHDPRIHWVGPPPAESGLVAEWRIGGFADGEPFAITGFIGYSASPGLGQVGGLPPWALVLAGVAGALVLAAALALPLRRREGESERERAS